MQIWTEVCKPSLKQVSSQYAKVFRNILLFWKLPITLKKLLMEDVKR